MGAVGIHVLYQMRPLHSAATVTTKILMDLIPEELDFKYKNQYKSATRS